MVGIYWVPTVDICRRICDIPHGPLCDNCNIAVFFPRTRERNSKKIFLATDDWCNYRRRPGGWINHPVLNYPSVIPWLDHGIQVWDTGITTYLECVNKK